MTPPSALIAPQLWPTMLYKTSCVGLYLLQLYFEYEYNTNIVEKQKDKRTCGSTIGSLRGALHTL